MHIYAFGSICRGEISQGSDTDLLAVINGYDARFDPEIFSIYSHGRIRELWQEGNPFAWHLSVEAKLIFAADQQDYLKGLGDPAPYKNYVHDCNKFYSLFNEAYLSIVNNISGRVFDLSTIFLSMRNIATCFSLGVTAQPNFARNSALHLEGDSIPLTKSSYHIFERARILCTRGYGDNLTQQDIEIAVSQLDKISGWMNKLVEKAKIHERI